MDNWNNSQKNLFSKHQQVLSLQSETLTLLFVFAEILLTLAMKNKHVKKPYLTTKELKIIGALLVFLTYPLKY